MIQIISAGDHFTWAMRKGDEAPFLRSKGYFWKASQAEADARAVAARGKAKVAYVEYI